MSTSALTLAVWGNDSPWRRLYWTLPAAISIWFVVLWAFAYFMGNPAERLPEPPAIEAQLIEIPVPEPTVNTPPEEKKSVPPPVKPVVPRKLQPTPLAAKPQEKIETNPPPIREEKPEVEHERADTPQANVEKSSPPIEEKPAEEPSSSAAPTTPKNPSPASTGTNLTGSSGAQAIVRPMPQIPDELRQDALSTSAVARFHVAADGTASVELVKPTPNPRLNRLLLDTLKHWRFFPSLKDGKPVASTEEIVIKVEVK